MMATATAIRVTIPPEADAYSAAAPPPGSGAYNVVVEDPDAVHARAAEAGAEVVRGPQDTDYGSREFSVRDLEGNIWSFGTYQPWAS